MNNKHTKWPINAWGWLQVTAGVIVLVFTALWDTQLRSQTQTIAQFLAMSATFALVLANYSNPI